MTDIPILFDKPFPEEQVGAPYLLYRNRVMGSVYVTGGFMEPYGHGHKSTPMKAIFRKGGMKIVPPGPHNIGFDYTSGFGSDVICMYSGKVSKAGFEGGYGYRIHIELDFRFHWESHYYKCYQAYAHNSRLLKAVGNRVSQGEAIAIEAGHGANGPNDYGSHVDLDTYIYIDSEKVHLNFEVLAGQINPHASIEPIEVMKNGSFGYDVDWLRLELGTSNEGPYNDRDAAVVKQFQEERELVPDGIAGKKTCTELEMYGYRIFIVNDTIIKQQPIQSSELENNDRYALAKGGAPLIVNWIEDYEDHWKFELAKKIEGKHNWFAYKDHVRVVKGYDKLDEPDGDLEIDNSPSDRWENALRECPTNGAGSTTIAQENAIGNNGIECSEYIAGKDYQNFFTSLLNKITSVSKQLNVPLGIVMGLASRETHVGTVLGKWGNNPGWGDNNHGFGILQVDKRYHQIQGLPDPYSEAHIKQAIGIFAQYRDQVAIAHPDWDDTYVLKGACVAYNAGVSNVQTIEGMNLGTTGNDYGDDVIARAQYYQEKT